MKYLYAKCFLNLLAKKEAKRLFYLLFVITCFYTQNSYAQCDGNVYLQDFSTYAIDPDNNPATGNAFNEPNVSTGLSFSATKTALVPAVGEYALGNNIQQWWGALGASSGGAMAVDGTHSNTGVTNLYRVDNVAVPQCDELTFQTDLWFQSSSAPITLTFYMDNGSGPQVLYTHTPDPNDPSDFAQWITTAAIPFSVPTATTASFYIDIDAYSGNSAGRNFGVDNICVSCAALSALSVELLSFNASKVDCNALIEWTTTSSANFSHFEVEKSNDGQSFVKIADVKAKSINNGIANYNFTNGMDDKEEYYRLKQVNNDGSYDYTQVVSISNQCNGLTGFELYPNPVHVNNELSIGFHTELPNTKLVITNISGKQLINIELENRQKGWNQHHVDISKLTTGMYLITDTQGNTERFVVAR